MTEDEKKTNNISIIWDFDKTLTPQDSTTELIRYFLGNKTQYFWEEVKSISGVDAKAPKVDDLVPKDKEWCPFENMIYIGDGDTDIPAFSLVKSRRGMTIGVYNPDLKKSEEIIKQAKNIKKGKRIDLFTPANFEPDRELFDFIKTRCKQIAKRYQAHKLSL